ncbi:immunoglobulin-like domain-containing protein [Paenibacillus thalictri]|uniref:Cadherin-like beta sandwich domain-containing protein n=1 Tax=Paenibacillus thalictri TaxID=2527873 RepID=A0A4Q9DFW9_9BACL|nr:immunoglobulin-like domain-containing protein [Paenibacillus thalictri]TBL68024.1 hypothetical protein EYB31_38845 [Paenibacillus thalictri]
MKEFWLFRVKCASALLGGLLLLLCLSLSVSAQSAGTEGGGTGSWQVSGPGTTNVTVDQATYKTTLTYAYQDTAVFNGITWTLQRQAAETGTIHYRWHYSGLHAWFQAKAGLSAFVVHADNTVTETTLLPNGSVVSGGFDERGDVSFQVNAGELYGFHVYGSNYDYNDFLNGTLEFRDPSPQLDVDDALSVISVGTIRGTNPDLDNVTTHLSLPSAGIYDTSVTWISDNSAVVTNSGVVSRPPYNGDDAIVQLTATVTKDVYSNSKNFTVKVLKNSASTGEYIEVPADGTVQFAEGMRLVFEPSALSAGAAVRLDASSPNVSGTGLQSVGSAVYLTVNGIVLNSSHPAMLSFSNTAGADLSKLGIFYWDSSKGWIYLPTTVQNGVAYASIDRSATYGLFVAQQASISVTPQPGAIVAGTPMTMIPSEEGGEIYYTLDGTNPSRTHGFRYDVAAKPVIGAGSSTFKVFAAAPNRLDSPIATWNYYGTYPAPELSSLFVSMLGNITLVPGVYQYAVTVDNSVSGVVYSAAVTAPGLKLQNGSTSVTGTVYLPVGATVLTFVVSSTDSGQQNSYTLTITRQSSGNADIAAVMYQSAPLQRTGDSFALSVHYEINRLELAVALSDSGSSMSVTGAVYQGNTITIPQLALGVNTFQIRVTAQNGADKTYSLNVVRLADPSLGYVDLNHDGTVTINDVLVWVQTPVDINLDGVTNRDDLIYLMRQIQPLSSR